jgi:outer membrane lipoprotein-sorting protein
MKNWNYILLLVIVIVFLLNSCKTTRIVGGINNLNALSSEEIIEKVEKNTNNAKSYSIRYNTKVRFLNKKHTLSGLLRIKTDSIIWISIGPSVGVELLRVIATKDSLKYINKTNNTFYIGDYEYLKRLTKLNIDFNMMEAVLLSNLFLYSSNNSLKEELIYTCIDSNSYILRNYKEKIKDYLRKDSQNDYLQRVEIEPGNFLIESINIKDKETNRNLNLEYFKYDEINNFNVPHEIGFKFDDVNSLIQLSLKYQKVIINKELKYPFRINKKFTSIN